MIGFSFIYDFGGGYVDGEMGGWLIGFIVIGEVLIYEGDCDGL